MKTKTYTLYLTFLACASSAQTNAIGMSPLPSDTSTWNDSDYYIAGMVLGFVLGCSSWLLRVVRQVGNQSPEI